MYMFDSPPRSPPSTPPPQNDSITLASLNVGGATHIMTATGNLKPEFKRFLKTLTEPFILFLHDLQIKHWEQRWKFFKAELHHAFPRAIAPRVHGKRGTAVIHTTNLPYEHSFEADAGENAIVMSLRLGNNQRFIIHGVYFPYALCNMSEVDATLERIQTFSDTPGDAQIVIGDLNPAKKPVWAWQTKLQRAGLVKIELGKTGFKAHTLEDEGEAQGIWISQTHLSSITLQQRPVIAGFETLSNCHRPITAKINIQGITSKPIIVRPNIRAECRIVGRGMASKLAAAAEKATNFSEISQACMTFTRPPPCRPQLLSQMRQEGTFYKKKNFNPRTPNHALVKMALRARNDNRKKKIQKLAITNPSAIARMCLGLNPPDIEADEPNVDYAKALSALSWLQSECGNMEDHIPECTHEELRKIASELKAPITAGDLIESSKKIKKNTTYPDLPAQVVLLMGPNALEIIADEFTKRLTQPAGGENITMIGLPTGKKLRTKDTGIFKVLQRKIRPIGLIDLFNAWFNITAQMRLSRIASTIAAPNMYAFLKGREGHDLIFQTMLRIDLANRQQRPIWIIKADAVKAFDRMQFKAIEALDKVAGNTGIFTAMAQTYSTVRLHIRIHQGPPCIVTPKSGGVQGDARNPPTWIALTANMAHAIDAHARQSDPTLTRESASFFADDGIFTSGQLKLVIERFKLAQSLMHGQGQELEIIAIARNEWSTTFEPNMKTLTHDNNTYEIQRSLCVLQACIHLTPGSECAQKKCKRCTKESTRTYCPLCEKAVAASIPAIELSILDQAEILNTHVTSAIMYANYSCTTQREWSIKFQESIRGPLHGASYGGYVEWAHLHTSVGGVGVIDVKRQSAINLMEIMDRITARPGRTQELAIALLSGTHTEWPRPIMETLNADPTFTIQITPHSSINTTRAYLEILRKSPHVQIWFWFTQEQQPGEQRPENWNAIHSLGIDSNQVYVNCSRKTKNLTNNERGSVNAQIRLLAVAIETLSKGKNEVIVRTIYPPEILKRIGEYERSLLRHKFHNRVYIDILRRTKIKEVPWFGGIRYGEMESLHETRHPAAFPFTILLNGHNWNHPYFAQHAASETKNQLKLLQIREAVARNQAAAVLLTLPKTDHTLSAITSTARVGSHHFSTLMTSEVNALVRWRSAAVIKTQRPGPCKFNLENGPCGQDATTDHIVSHISMMDQIETINKCEGTLHKTEGQLQRSLVPGHIPLAMWLGFVTPETVTWTSAISHPKNAKAHKLASQKISTIFAKKGLQILNACLPTHPLAPAPTPHERLWERNDHRPTTTAPTNTITGESDASGPIPDTGECGIAGIILDEHGNLIYSFQAYIVLPPRTSSTIAEYLGQLILLCAVHRLKLHKGTIALYRCFKCDNMAVVEQLDGEWHTNAECRAIRVLIHKVEAEMEDFERKWISRTLNSRSDQLAGEARKKRLTIMHHKELYILKKVVQQIWETHDSATK